MHESPLSSFEARLVAQYLEGSYNFCIDWTSFLHKTPEAVSDFLMTRFGLSIDADEIRKVISKL